MSESKLECPYCGSRKVLSYDEYRFCCIFGHGEKTLADLDEKTIENCIKEFEVLFECETCGRSFYVTYKLSGIKIEEK